MALTLTEKEQPRVNEFMMIQQLFNKLVHKENFNKKPTLKFCYKTDTVSSDDSSYSGLTFIRPCEGHGIIIQIQGPLVETKKTQTTKYKFNGHQTSWSSEPMPPPIPIPYTFSGYYNHLLYYLYN